MRRRKKAREKMRRRITIRLDYNLYEALKERVIKRGRGKLSTFVREAIREQLDKIKN